METFQDKLICDEETGKAIRPVGCNGGVVSGEGVGVGIGVGVGVVN